MPNKREVVLGDTLQGDGKYYQPKPNLMVALAKKTINQSNCSFFLKLLFNFTDRRIIK